MSKDERVLRARLLPLAQSDVAAQYELLQSFRNYAKSSAIALQALPIELDKNWASEGMQPVLKPASVTSTGCRNRHSTCYHRVQMIRFPCLLRC